MLVPVAMNKVGMKTNADVNVKNYLRKECAIKDVFGMLVIVSVNVVKYAILENIYIIKIVSVEKG